MGLTDKQWMDALSDSGEAFDNDFDEGIGGIFGFSITVPGDSNNYSNPVLTASFERALDEDEPREGNGDYAKKETRRWLLIPFEGAERG
jgi:hypothetical protein